MDPISTRLALLGFGDVAQALAHRLREGSYPLRVTSISDTSGTIVDDEGLALDEILHAKEDTGRVTDATTGTTQPWTTEDAARNAPADVVVQLTPSNVNDPRRGLDEITNALDTGRDVVTAAKDALATHPGTLDAAREEDTRFLCSASVGGSTPMLETLDTLRGHTLLRIAGVLNGSTTHMLSQMEQGTPFGEALDDARDAGLLEADAKADLLGTDAAAKAAILHQRAYGSTLTIDQVPTEGITELDTQACQHAKHQGFALRLVAHIGPDGARVRPVNLPREDPLVTDGPQAAARLVFENAGDIVLHGPGAGPSETASTVLNDVLTIAT